MNTPPRITDKHFIDWENDTFGFGYGTGEEYILPALKAFFESLQNGDGRSYDHRVLEVEFGPLPAWLLINTLCHADILEYGTSARHGWLTEKGEVLRDYIVGKHADQLYEICMSIDQDYIHCYSGRCNCDTHCRNPLFSE